MNRRLKRKWIWQRGAKWDLLRNPAWATHTKGGGRSVYTNQSERRQGWGWWNRNETDKTKVEWKCTLQCSIIGFKILSNCFSLFYLKIHFTRLWMPSYKNRRPTNDELHPRSPLDTSARLVLCIWNHNIQDVRYSLMTQTQTQTISNDGARPLKEYTSTNILQFSSL